MRPLLAVVVVGALGGCGDRQHASVHVDAVSNPSVHYTLNVTVGDVGRPARAMPPEVFIDGVQTRMLEVDYPGLEVLTAVHHVELRLGTTVVASRDTDLNDLDTEYNDCNASIHGQGGFTTVQLSTCEYDSGDLRNGLPFWNGPNGGCVADFDCGPSCYPNIATTCAAGLRCTSRATSLSPLFTHLACAPIGDKRLGEACQLIDDPLGAFDDCGESLLCVAGTCHATCTPMQGGCPTCAFVDGEPPELGACL